MTVTALYPCLAWSACLFLTTATGAPGEGTHSDATSIATFPTRGPDWKPTGKSIAVTVVTVGSQALALGLGEQSVWVLADRGRHILQIDPCTGQAIGSGMHVSAWGLAAGHGSLWATHWKWTTPVLQRLDPQTGQILTNFSGFGGGIAFDEKSVWVAGGHRHYVARFDPKTNQRIAAIAVSGSSSHLAVGAGAVWAFHPHANLVTRIDPSSNQAVQAIRLGPAVRRSFGLAASDDAVWAAVGYGVVRIDPKTNRVVRTIPVGVSPFCLAVAGGWVWVGGDDGTVSRIDPRTNELVDQVSLTHRVLMDVAVASGAVWLVGGEKVFRIDL